MSMDSEGRLRVVVENVDIPVALSASEDSVLVYGKNVDTGSIAPIAVDDSGKIRVSSIDQAVSVDGVVSVDNFPSDYPDSGTHERLDTIASRLYDSVEQKSVTDVVKDIRDRIYSLSSQIGTSYGLRSIIYALSESGQIQPVTIGSGGALNVNLASDEMNLRVAIPTVFDGIFRRGGNRLLTVVDFSINCLEGWPSNDINMGNLIIMGASSWSIVSCDDEGIPYPEGTGSKYVLKITVPASGTVYIRVPIRARYFYPFAAYVSVYNRDYEMEYKFYVSLGGKYQSGTRQVPPVPLRLPANTWGRFVTHWFMEAHHGCAEIDIEISNPNSSDVTVYVGVITSCEIDPWIKGYGLILGFEGSFYIPLNNSTFDWMVDVMLPTNAGDVMQLHVELGIQSDDGTEISGEILFHPGGRSLISGSTTTSTVISRDIKVWSGRHNYFGYQTFSIEFRASTTGSGRVTQLQVVVECFCRENTYQKWVEGSVGAGSTVTLVDYWNDDKHVVGGKIEVTAGAGGSLDVVASTPEGDVKIASVPAGQTRTVEIVGRYVTIKLVNNDASNAASYSGYLVISQSLLIQ